MVLFPQPAAPEDDGKVVNSQYVWRQQLVAPLLGAEWKCLPNLSPLHANASQLQACPHGDDAKAIRVIAAMMVEELYNKQHGNAVDRTWDTNRPIPEK